MKNNILAFINRYLPGYKAGGPIRSVSNLVEELGDEYNFKIITTDRDSFEKEPYNNIKVNDWNRVGKADVFYLDESKISISRIRKILRDTNHDLIYLNSFFSLKFSIYPVIIKFLLNGSSAPLLLAPRGDFSEGAVNLKRYKKKPYLFFFKKFGLAEKISWHASNEYEVSDIKREIGDVKNIYQALNISINSTNDNNKNEVEVKTYNHKFNIIYLSRITKKKNLHFALNGLSRIKDSPIKLNIVGHISDEKYWSNCKVIINNLPDNISVEYIGTVENELVKEIVGKHDLLILPTKGENYGHVIYESLSSGTPVLISDQTPWMDIEKEGVGWIHSINEYQSFTNRLNKIIRIEKKEIGKIRERAKRYVKKKYNKNDLLKKYKKMFNETAIKKNKKISVVS